MSKLLILGFIVAFYPFQTIAQLDQHRWEDRVILIIAENDQLTAYKDQIQFLSQQRVELEDRNLVVYKLLMDGQSTYQENNINTTKAQKLIQNYKKKSDPFLLLLIGKDGGVKLKSTTPVSPNDLFALIDGMPMRRAEMRRKKGYK